MIRGMRPRRGGYTIIEVIIVLTVSSALLVTATALFTRRIPATQFSNTVNEFESKIRDTQNEVVNGYYPSSPSAACGTGAQGTNEDCIVLGRAIQFAAGVNGCSNSSPTSCSVSNVYTVFGNRLTSTPPIKTVTTLSEANPRLLGNGPTPASTSISLGYGAYISRVISGGNELAGVAFLQTFGSSINNTGDPLGGSQVEARTIPVAPLSSLSARLNPVQFNTGATGGINAGTVNPNSGILVCITGGRQQRAIVTIGDNNRAMSTKVEFMSETAWAARGC